MKNKITKTSKFLSYVLRHNPGEIGIELDENGWVAIEQLIEKSNQKGKDISKALLFEVVETNDKQRFAISSDGAMIRANQGHSIDIELDLKPQTPPDKLLHGTAVKWLDAIKVDGLVKKNRHHVHLTENRAVASSVGRRFGKLVLLEIDAKQMCEDGIEFYVTANGVWLVNSVPPEYLKEIDE
ncbi:RNA 2'-phosphotransferase [Aliikangiella coralliicola]|uniref:Probable RNA 2'-phosphotransferase n=1 Tax=Aliikangiella coralliicola TaxID=2592383 RepID=A0A545UF21_9GAMM|nr:RNA 2'-phosphotransferase [Aliikangiella coralliicola]TQV87983.1 RNA 2'-phosphotransferase [Aliikangiella coralliicola]